MTTKKDDFLVTQKKNSKVFIGATDQSQDTADFINRYANRGDSLPNNLVVVNGDPVVIDADYVTLDL